MQFLQNISRARASARMNTDGQDSCNAEHTYCGAMVAVLKSMPPPVLDRVIYVAQADAECNVCEPGKQPEKKRKRYRDPDDGSRNAKKVSMAESRSEGKNKSLIVIYQGKQKSAAQKKRKTDIPIAERVDMDDPNTMCYLIVIVLLQLMSPLTRGAVINVALQ